MDIVKTKTEYFNKETLVKILSDLDNEIDRSKIMVNENGYHHGTAFNAIVRSYRNDLKQYRKVVNEDLQDLLSVNGDGN